MNWFRPCVAAGGLILLLGCASTGSVRTARDPQASLAAYHTFALLPLPDRISETDPGLALRVAPVITRSVKDIFRRKGYEEAPVREADVAIFVRGKMVPHVDVTTWGYMPYYGRVGWTKKYPYAYGYQLQDARTFEENTLIVEVYDNRTRKMVWVGWATSGKTPDRAREAARINDALERILAHYPAALPQPRSSSSK
jgi:hypothetical protein